jgi:hypothetical protein
MRQDGLEAFAFRCDVTDPRQVRDMALSAREAMGRIDILVNNASTATSNPVGRITLAEWEHIMAVNATGTFLCTQAVFEDGRAALGARGERRLAGRARGRPLHRGVRRGEARRRGLHEGGRGGGGRHRRHGERDLPRLRRHAPHRRGDRQDHAPDGQVVARRAAAMLDHAGQDRLVRAGEVAEADPRLLQSEDARSRNGEIVVLDGNDRP